MASPPPSTVLSSGTTTASTSERTSLGSAFLRLGVATAAFFLTALVPAVSAQQKTMADQAGSRTLLLDATLPGTYGICTPLTAGNGEIERPIPSGPNFLDPTANQTLESIANDQFLVPTVAETPTVFIEGKAIAACYGTVTANNICGVGQGEDGCWSEQLLENVVTVQHWKGTHDSWTGISTNTTVACDGLLIVTQSDYSSVQTVPSDDSTAAMTTITWSDANGWNVTTGLNFTIPLFSLSGIAMEIAIVGGKAAAEPVVTSGSWDCYQRSKVAMKHQYLPDHVLDALYGCDPRTEFAFPVRDSYRRTVVQNQAPGGPVEALLTNALSVECAGGTLWSSYTETWSEKVYPEAATGDADSVFLRNARAGRQPVLFSCDGWMQFKTSEATIHWSNADMAWSELSNNALTYGKTNLLRYGVECREGTTEERVGLSVVCDDAEVLGEFCEYSSTSGGAGSSTRSPLLEQEPAPLDDEHSVGDTASPSSTVQSGTGGGTTTTTITTGQPSPSSNSNVNSGGGVGMSSAPASAPGAAPSNSGTQSTSDNNNNSDGGTTSSSSTPLQAMFSGWQGSFGMAALLFLRAHF